MSQPEPPPSPAVVELARQAAALERLATTMSEQIGPDLRKTARALERVSRWEPGSMLADLASVLSKADQVRAQLRAEIAEWDRRHPEPTR
jgi:hypothetical protein